MARETKRLNFVIDEELADKMHKVAIERGIGRTALLVRWLRTIKTKDGK